MVKREDWDELVERYGSSLYRYALAVLGAEAEAKDAVQDAFIKIFKGNLRSKDKEKEWVFTIIRNTCRDRKRHLFRFTRFISGPFTEGRDWSVSPIEPVSMRTKEALRSLPMRQLEVFVLRHIQEFSTEETADFLNISEGAVKSHLSRAVAALREKLEGKGEYES